MSVFRALLWAAYWAAIVAICTAAEIVAQITITGQTTAAVIGVLAAAAIALTGYTYATTRKDGRR